MAQRTTVRLVDDVDGTDIPEGAGETIRFGLDGVLYEIDLTPDNAAKLRAAFTGYIDHGRRASTRAGGTSSSRSSGRTSSAGKRSPEETKAIKAWAAANGHQVAERGPIARAVLDAYEAAH